MRKVLLLTVLLLVAACAPTLQPPGDAPGPPVMLADQAIMDDGRRLPVRYWPAESEQAVAIALHGFNDYANAFVEPGPWWSARGISVYAYDQRGFGGTAYRGFWPGTDRLVADLQVMIRLAAQAHPGKPIYVIGESMGGAVAIVAATRPDSPKIDGLVLSAPAVWGRRTMNPVYRFVLWVVPRIMPAQRLSGRGLNIQASDNIPMLIALGRDPMIIKETRADAVEGLADLMDAALTAAPDLKTPTLLLYGAKDQVIPKGAIDRMVGSLNGGYRLALYDNGWHMLMRDLDRQVVWRDAATWMIDRRAVLPSGAEKPAGQLAYK